MDGTLTRTVKLMQRLDNQIKDKPMMTKDQFKNQLLVIEEQRQSAQNAVDGKYEQRLGKLFVSSEWTQQQIAEAVGKSQNTISQLLCFGRFLQFIASGDKFKIPADLSERKFRSYWKNTDKMPKEAKRFTAVAQAMEDADYVTPISLRDKIVDACSNGEFVSKSDMVKAVGCTPKQLEDNWNHIGKDKRYHIVNNNGSPRHRKYKVVKAGRVVDLDLLMSKIEPLLQDITRQGKCEGAAQYSPAVILIAVNQLRKVLEEGAKNSPTASKTKR